MSWRENRERKKVKKVYLYDYEWDYIQQKIEMSPFDNFTNYARNILIQKGVRAYDYSQLIDVKKEIN